MAEFKVVKAYRTKHVPEGRIHGLGIEFVYPTETKVLNIDSKVVIAKIKQGGRAFYVEGGGFKAYLEIATSDKTGLEYLRTEKDQTPLDNLSYLPTEVWSPYEWDTPTLPVTIPCQLAGYQHYHTWNTVIPPVLSTQGLLIPCNNEASIPIGFSNHYDGDYLIGSVGSNTFARALITADISGLDTGIIRKATITLKLHQTKYWMGSYASNEGSALYSVWELRGPWTQFVAPFEMPASSVIMGVPTWGGTLYQAPSWKKDIAASFDVAERTIILDVTRTVEHWRSAISENYGIMLVGTDESEQKNNNSFYSEYELIGINADQTYDW